MLRDLQNSTSLVFAHLLSLFVRGLVLSLDLDVSEALEGWSGRRIRFEEFA